MSFSTVGAIHEIKEVGFDISDCIITISLSVVSYMPIGKRIKQTNNILEICLVSVDRGSGKI